MSKTPPRSEQRVEITKHIRVLYGAKPDGFDWTGWAVVDDFEEECPCFETRDEAVAYAQKLSSDYHDRWLEDGKPTITTVEMLEQQARSVTSLRVQLDHLETVRRVCCGYFELIATICEDTHKGHERAYTALSRIQCLARRALGNG